MAIGIRDRRALALVAVLALAALAGCSQPSPSPVCAACEEGVESAVGSDDLDVNASSMDIYLRDDGDARIHVRAVVSGSNVSELETAPDRVDAIARDAVGADDQYRDTPLGSGEVRNLTATYAPPVLRIEYTLADVGTPRDGDILFVDAFHSRGGQPEAHPLGTDQLRVHGPNGSSLLNDPEHGRVTNDGRTVAWESPQDVSGSTYLVYGESNGPVERATGQWLIAVDVFDWIVPRLYFVVPFVPIWGAVAGGLLSWKRPTAPGGQRLRDLYPPSRRALGTTLSIALLVLTVVTFSTKVNVMSALWDFVYFPVLPVLCFGLHGAVVARDSPWQWPMVLVLAAIPLVAGSGVAARPIPQPGYVDPVAFLMIVGLLWLFVLCPISWYIGFWLGNRSSSAGST